MDNFTELVSAEKTILLDGAMGTMLIAAGMETGGSPDEMNITNPDVVRGVHKAYIQAGSRIVLTNSFGGTGLRMKQHGYEDRVLEFNQAAAENARSVAEAAPHLVVVAGSMGPTGEMMKPMGKLTFDDAKAAFAEQAQGLAAGGVDVFWVETMSDLEEVRAAVEGAKSVSDLPVVVTMTFDTNGRTMMGVSPEKAMAALIGSGVVALGGNCGNGPEEIFSVIEKMTAENADIPLVAKANAGLPKIVNGEIVYDGTPQVMADYAVKVRDKGATFIGACCGSSPDHIRAMANALDLPTF